MNTTRNLIRVVVASTVGMWATAASAQIVMDGTADAAYGSALSIQNTKTHFGDNSSPDLIATADGGSEINQVFGTVANGRLYVTITGNLETNFNKLEVYLDSVSGGVNEIVGTDLPSGVDAFCCGGFGTTDGALQRQDFLVFDDGFEADYYMTFTNGSENVGGRDFWALSAHYAELFNGTNGNVVSAGMQLGPKGLPNALRGPLGSDLNSDFDVDGADFLTWQRGFGIGTTKVEGDANEDGTVDGADLSLWENRFGQKPNLQDFSFVPTADSGISTENLIGPDLPGLSQGDVIDQTYALGDGGCTGDDTDGGAGCIAPELELTLPVDSNDPNNDLNHRDMLNSIGLQMAFDNSNIAGVEGGTGEPWETEGDPENVLTGLEFSLPLSAIGDPTGDIRLLAFVNSGGHDFVSNQFSGEGVLRANFGNLPPDLEVEAAGDQFVTIPHSIAVSSTSVPEPTAMVLVVLGLAGHVLSGARHRRVLS